MKDTRALKNLYDNFFKRIHRHVLPEGYVFIYTTEISLVEKNLRLNSDYLTLVEHYDVPRGKTMAYFFIIQVNKKKNSRTSFSIKINNDNLARTTVLLFLGYLNKNVHQMQVLLI